MSTSDSRAKVYSDEVDNSEEPEETPESEAPEEAGRPWSFKAAAGVLIWLIAIISVTGNILMYKRWSSQRVLIRVNGQNITRKDLDDRVDVLYARGLLNQMIWSALVRQEATKRRCMPTSHDVDQALNDLDRSDSQILTDARKTDPALVMFRDTLLSSLALRNLQIADVALAPGEAQRFYENHKSLFSIPEKANKTAVLATDQEAADAARNMLAQNVAPDILNSSPGVRLVDFDSELMNQLPADAINKIKSLSAGQIGEYPLDGQYLVVKVNSVLPAYTPPYSQIADKVEIAARLDRAPTQGAILANLRRRATIVAESDKYADAVPAAVQPLTGSP